MKNKNIILFVGPVENMQKIIVQDIKKKNKLKYRIAFLYDSRKQKNKGNLLDEIDIILYCNFDSSASITKTLLPYKDQIIAVTTFMESNIPYLQKIIPHLPYLPTPTVQSLEWATQKIAMREMFFLYDKTISPIFTVVHDSKKATLKKIEEGVGFPLVVKPAGLASSLLVNVCFHKEELEKVLRMTFRKIKRIYKNTEGRGEPSVLVEQFMDGEMYSIDAYVDSKGHMSFCPLVHVKTGRSIGFDDFFGYQRITPTTLGKDAIKAAKKIASKAVHALKLRSVSVHIEMLQTNDGWKIIELGPRTGGFRHVMYKKSFGINHIMNDVLIRIPEKPIIPKKVLGHTAVLQFFAKQEGILTGLTGIKKVQELKSFYDIDINKKLGDRCLYAKNGGKSVFNITLFNKERSELLADIRRLEQMVEIETETKTNSKLKSLGKRPKKK